MDFIERLFGIAPDGGSGTLEMALFLILLAALFLWWYVRQRPAGAPRGLSLLLWSAKAQAYETHVTVVAGARCPYQHDDTSRRQAARGQSGRAVDAP
jgi:hypothetical protein